MQDAAAIQGMESRYAALATLMDERIRRQWAAAEARFYGWVALLRRAGTVYRAIARRRKVRTTPTGMPNSSIL